MQKCKGYISTEPKASFGNSPKYKHLTKGSGNQFQFKLNDCDTLIHVGIKGSNLEILGIEIKNGNFDLTSLKMFERNIHDLNEDLSHQYKIVLDQLK